jgi:hypothetical protein
MATNQAYGDELAKRLRAENVAATITRLRQNAIVAITEVRRDNPIANDCLVNSTGGCL